jgi:hypothetical protein
MNLVLAAMQAKAGDPEAWSILLDEHGNLAEGTGSNIFLVQDGEIRTPRERYVLPGVSRGTVIDLARELGIPLAEADIDLYDAANADEIFVTDQPGRMPGREVQRRHGGTAACRAGHEAADRLISSSSTAISCANTRGTCLSQKVPDPLPTGRGGEGFRPRQLALGAQHAEALAERGRLDLARLRAAR